MKRNGFQIVDFDYTALTDYIINESVKRKILLTYFNFSTANLLLNDAQYYVNMKNSFILHCDGVGAYFLAGIFLGFKFRNNINGSNLYPVLVNKILKLNKKIFLVLSSNNQSHYIKNSIEEYFKNDSGKVGFCIYNEKSHEDIINSINSFKPDAVFVGMGQPAQENWLLNNKDYINANLMVSSGSGFEFLLGQKKRSPLWMRKIGLEWLYRLFQEPKRLWKRYILGIPLFIFHVFVQKVKLTLKKV